VGFLARRVLQHLSGRSTDTSDISEHCYLILWLTSRRRLVRFANGLLRHHSESGPTDPYGAWREGHVSGVNRMECDQLGCAGRDCKSVYTGSNPVSTSGDWRSGSALP
jgi:hypothetical protein